MMKVAQPSQSAHPPMQYGVFSGGFNPEAAARYEDWLGRKSDFNVEFLTETAYTDYVGADGKKVTDSMAHLGWLLGVWSQSHRADRNMLFSVPLATKQDRSLAHVAAGQYDDTFENVARAIAKVYPHAIIRIGWEFNADWYSWSAKGRAQDYVNAFRHVAKIFKSASHDFTIDWCPDHGFSANMPADTAYPGDDVVDVIGMDFYNDYRWGNYKDDPEKRWEWYKTFSYGLDWQVKFAAAHNKPMSMPEWGVNRDDPLFISKVHDWLTNHDFAYEAYWNSNSAFAGALSNNQYPNAAAAYKRLFSAGSEAHE
jgi:beta-mannanase